MIRGTHAVASSSEKQGNDGHSDRGDHETPGHTVETSIYIYTMYSMSNIAHVNTHTHTHTLISLLLDKEIGTSNDAKGLVSAS